MTFDRLPPATLSFLPAFARAAINAALRDRPRPSVDDVAAAMGRPVPTGLEGYRGVFVTLTRGGMLRGCIGTLSAGAPLADAVHDNALAAARHDPRFAPLTNDELEVLHVEVSVLTPLRAVAGVDDIDIPRHGVVLSKAGRRAVFLPQVALEQGWDRETTLNHLAVKAGLDPDAWREGASFEVFEAEIAAEDPPTPGPGESAGTP